MNSGRIRSELQRRRRSSTSAAVENDGTPRTKSWLPSRPHFRPSVMFQRIESIETICPPKEGMPMSFSSCPAIAPHKAVFVFDLEARKERRAEVAISLEMDGCRMDGARLSVGDLSTLVRCRPPSNANSSRRPVSERMSALVISSLSPRFTRRFHRQCRRRRFVADKSQIGRELLDGGDAIKDKTGRGAGGTASSSDLSPPKARPIFTADCSDPPAAVALHLLLHTIFLCFLVRPRHHCSIDIVASKSLCRRHRPRTSHS